MTESTILASLPIETADALAVLLQHRHGQLLPLGEGDAAAVADAGIATVWTVEADDRESGYDLDNRTTLRGVYASLPVAVAATWRAIVLSERVYRPVFSQMIVQDAMPAAPASTEIECVCGYPAADRREFDDHLDATLGSTGHHGERTDETAQHGPF